nr:PREDICTED: odorant receptor 47a-like [Megachile rotundata]
MGKVSKNSIDYYILPNKILCSMIGMWPFSEERSTCRNAFSCFRLVFSVTAVCTIFVPGIMIIVVKWGDLKILTGVGCILTTLAQCLFKTIYLVARKERSHRLYKELRSLWDSTDDPTEMQCYQDLAHVARTCTITFYSCGALTSIVFIISAALECMNVDVSNGTDSIRPLPFEVWYGIDVSESPRFEVVFVCQALASTICAVAICSLDTACVTAILHVCGQFKLISVWISHIGFETDCNLTNYLVDSRRNLRTDLVKCIRHQQRLINVVKDVNTLMTPIIFIQILTSGIEICLSGFAVFSYDAGGDLFKFISYLASMMVQLLLWCWPGEILAQESQKIGHSVYLNIPWYQLPLIYRKKILLMILRSQKYCSISALTFQSLSIYTLTSVFNTASSYFALLRQIQDQST